MTSPFDQTAQDGPPLAAAAHSTRCTDLRRVYLSAARRAPCFYRRGSDGTEWLGLGVAVADSAATDGFQASFARLADLLAPVADRHPRLVGWTAFDPQSDRPKQADSLPGWRAFPRRVLYCPQVLLRGAPGGAEALVVAPADRLDAVWQSWEQLIGQPLEPRPAQPSPAKADIGDCAWLDEDAFRAGIRQVTEERVAPKVVLARRALVAARRDIDVGSTLDALAHAYPSCTLFAISPSAELAYPAFVGATPELLARVERGQVETMALAGTAQPGDESALLESTKDRDEHRFVLDMIVEALGPLCSTVAAADQPAVHRLANVSHLLTRISGQLNDGVGLAGVVDALHPTPAVCGTPRERARQLISAFEGFDRGLYAGAFGSMDLDGSGEFDVALRCGLVDRRAALLFAGAGITRDSDVDVELRETRDKFSPMLRALTEVPS